MTQTPMTQSLSRLPKPSLFQRLNPNLTGCLPPAQEEAEPPLVVSATPQGPQVKKTLQERLGIETPSSSPIFIPSSWIYKAKLTLSNDANTPIAAALQTSDQLPWSSQGLLLQYPRHSQLLLPLQDPAPPRSGSNQSSRTSGKAKAQKGRTRKSPYSVPRHQGI